jgi:hypothetical protein
VSLAWDPPPKVGLAGYALYVGRGDGTYPKRIDVGSNTTVTLTGLTAGQTNCFVVRAYNTAGLEGPASTEADFVAPLVVTNAPPANPPVWTPPPLQIASGSQLVISAPVISNLAYILQGSSDLASWSFDFTNQPGAALNVAVTPPRGSSWRFYRGLLVGGNGDSNRVAQAVSNRWFTANAVGYTGITMSRGYTLISNPFDSGTNTLAALLPNVPPGSVIYKYTTGQGYTSNTFSGGQWTAGATTLDPGDGGFIYNPSRNSPTLVFAGRVLQGNVTNYLPAGYSIASAAIPSSDALSTFPGVTGDVIQCYKSKWISYTNVAGAWVGNSKNGPLVLKPGGAFFITKQTPANWVQAFWPSN